MMMKRFVAAAVRLSLPFLLTGAVVASLAPRPASAEDYRFDFHPPTLQEQNAAAIADFRAWAVDAGRAGSVGAFPNFHTAQYGPSFVAGTIFVGGAVAQWRDVP